MQGLENYIQNSNAWMSLLGKSKTMNKAKHKQSFVKVMDTNIQVVEDLLKEARKLSADGRNDDSDRILRIAEEVLNSNKQLQNTVVEVLASDD